MKTYQFVSMFLVLALLLSPWIVCAPSSTLARAAEAPAPVPAQAEALPPTLAGVANAGGDAAWWAAAQENLRQSEYAVTWQDQTYLADLPAAYQAPNRAHNLRIYFSEAGVRVIPRLFEGHAPPWEWGVAVTGYGAVGNVQPVAGARLVVAPDQIEYQRAALTEWYRNSAAGLEQGFTLKEPPLTTGEPGGEAAGRIVLELTFSGDPSTGQALTPYLTGDGAAVDFLTAGGVRVLRYSDLVVQDAANRTLPAHLTLVAPRTLRLTLDAHNAVYPITVDPLATSPDWAAEIHQTNAYFGHSVVTAGDVNGDGYSDVIVGAVGYDRGMMDGGGAFVYYGSAGGLATGVDWTTGSDQAGASFGDSVGTAGDVNGDGYSDVIIGAPTYNNGLKEEGRAYVYLGSADGLLAAPAWTAEGGQAKAFFGASVGTAGDVNGDGYSDVIVGAYRYAGGKEDKGRAYVYHGSANGLSAAADWIVESDQVEASFGISVGTAGDVNGDGFSDVIVGAPAYDNGQVDEGRAYVYQGSAGGLSTRASWTGESNQAGASFGIAVGTAGDVNGDGYSDILVGASRYDHGQTDEGGAFVYYGSAFGIAARASWIAYGSQAEANFGMSVGTAGDVNGDGYSDVIVSAPYHHNDHVDEGRAYVYHGSAGGLSPTANWSIKGDQPGAFLSISVGTAGDVNGDGFSDVIVSAPYYHNDQEDEGRAYVYHGSAGGLAAAASWSAASNQAGANFGIAVGTAGDVNGDGYSDIIVGASRFDNGQVDEGRAYLYYGSATGPATKANWTVESNQAGANLGGSVGTAGDVNGDGYSDVIVGASNYANGRVGEGRVFVYHGSVDGLSTLPNWIADGNQAGANFGFSAGTAGDVNGDGYSDVIVGAFGYDSGQTDQGRAYVYHGSAGGLSPAVDWTAAGDQAGAYFGFAIGTAGDVNGDGYSDVIIGAPTFSNGQKGEGQVYVYHGSADGLSPEVDWTAAGSLWMADFGFAVGTAGDVNGDGFSDVIIGAPAYENDQVEEGRAFVYQGSVDGLSEKADWSAQGNQEGARFGSSVGTAGDVNGDGYSEVIVGAPTYGNGQVDEGGAFVYQGSKGGLSTLATWSAESNQAGANYGASVGTAGDVNGDGYSEVIVGAPHFITRQISAGIALLYYGNGQPGVSLQLSQRRSDDSAPLAQLGQSSDLAFRLALTGRTPYGRGLVKLEWEVKPLGTAFDGLSLQQSQEWVDTGRTGAAINELVGGLLSNTAYHWRVRLQYNPVTTPFQQHSRWLTIPWNGWNEADLRSGNVSDPTE